MGEIQDKRAALIALMKELDESRHGLLETIRELGKITADLDGKQQALLVSGADERSAEAGHRTVRKVRYDGSATAETKEPEGPARGGRTCSVCGKTGHNARSHK